jgi:hypothetical protein
MDTEARLSDFHESLAEFTPGDHPGGQIADIFNALLGEVEKEHADDPIVSVIKPVGKTQTGRSGANAGTLRTSTQQLLRVVQEGGRKALIA